MNPQATFTPTILPEPFDVLVTGSSGHLGTALMLALPEMGFNPVGMDILPSDNTIYVGNIANRDFISNFVYENPKIKYIIHAASLHKPHMATHSDPAFVDSNIVGTQALIEAAERYCMASFKADPFRAFVFISTTSNLGDFLGPPPGNSAYRINEMVNPVPKDIYGRTKATAESLCALGSRMRKIPTVVLRVSDFFPEEDDEARRVNMADDNLKALKLAYQRVDIADVVDACRCAMDKASALKFAKFIISAPSPFQFDEETLGELDDCPQMVFERLVPGISELFDRKGWRFVDRIDRVYDATRAVVELEWKPKHHFMQAIRQIILDKEWRSELSLAVGNRGYPSAALEDYVIPTGPIDDPTLLEPAVP